MIPAALVIALEAGSTVVASRVAPLSEVQTITVYRLPDNMTYTATIDEPQIIARSIDTAIISKGDYLFRSQFADALANDAIYTGCPVKRLDLRWLVVARNAQDMQLYSIGFNNWYQQCLSVNGTTYVSSSQIRIFLERTLSFMNPLPGIAYYTGTLK